MVTLAQIEDVHDRLGSRESLGAYVRELREIGVSGYDSFLSDGRTEFSCSDGTTLTSGVHHEALAVVAEPDHAAIHDALAKAQRGDSSYLEMSKELADAGLERWSVDTVALTMTYVDIAGRHVLVEQLT